MVDLSRGLIIQEVATVIAVSIHVIHALGLISSESTRTEVGHLLVASACCFARLGLLPKKQGHKRFRH